MNSSVINKILHRALRTVRRTFVPDQLPFPQGHDLEQTMNGLQQLAGLPYCTGAFGGTFFRIRKPTSDYPDSYFCYT